MFLYIFFDQTLPEMYENHAFVLFTTKSTFIPKRLIKAMNNDFDCSEFDHRDKQTYTIQIFSNTIKILVQCSDFTIKTELHPLP